jgi:hypothetical protein
MCCNIKTHKKYLIMLSFILSLFGIILMIIGYSKIHVKLEITDVFDPITGNNYSLEKIMERIRENFNTTETHYYMITSGLCMGLSCTSSLLVLVVDIFKDDKQHDIFMIENPLRPNNSV